MSTAQDMLRVENLSITLGQFALYDVSLSVTEGRYFCLLGPTGAGKTVLLECVVGLHRPSTGRICMEGQDITDLSPETRQIGYVPQDYALFPHMDVSGNIGYGLVERGLGRAEISERVGQMAELLQISDLLDRRVSTLSGGERQRVALARVLILDCRLLLLDEPLTALDQVTKRELGDYLRDLHGRLELTVIHVTHDFSEAFSLASDVGIIHRGRLLQVGEVQDVFARPKGMAVARFLGLANAWAINHDILASCPLLQEVARSLPAASNGQRFLCIPPDRIHLSRESELPCEFSAQGVLCEVRCLGAVRELVVDIGTPLMVTLSTQEHHWLNCQVGDKVYAGVDRSALHVFSDS